jgi:hypothetical protein
MITELVFNGRKGNYKRLATYPDALEQGTYLKSLRTSAGLPPLSIISMTAELIIATTPLRRCINQKDFIYLIDVI